MREFTWQDGLAIVGLMMGAILFLSLFYIWMVALREKFYDWRELRNHRLDVINSKAPPAALLKNISLTPNEARDTYGVSTHGTVVLPPNVTIKAEWKHKFTFLVRERYALTDTWYVVFRCRHCRFSLEMDVLTYQGMFEGETLRETDKIPKCKGPRQ